MSFKLILACLPCISWLINIGLMRDDNDDWWSTSIWRWQLSTDAGSWLDLDEDRSKLIRYVILCYNWSGENETTIQGKRFIKKGKQDRRWICSSKKKRWDRAKRLLRATKTLRAYVECTRDVITKKSPCCSKQLQSLINLLFRLILTHRRRPNPWHHGTDHSVAVISNQSRPSKFWNWQRTKGAKMGSNEGLRVVKHWYCPSKCER